MIKKQWFLAVIATGVLFVSSLICLICSATLYRRLVGPFPIFNRLVVRGTAEQILQNYTAPFSLKGTEEEKTLSIGTLYTRRSRSTEASLPGLTPDQWVYSFPDF